MKFGKKLFLAQTCFDFYVWGKFWYLNFVEIFSLKNLWRWIIIWRISLVKFLWNLICWLVLWLLYEPIWRRQHPLEFPSSKSNFLEKEEVIISCFEFFVGSLCIYVWIKLHVAYWSLFKDHFSQHFSFICSLHARMDFNREKKTILRSWRPCPHFRDYESLTEVSQVF